MGEKRLLGAGLWERRANVLAAQLEADHALNLGKNLRVGNGAALLVVVDDRRLLVDLLRVPKTANVG